MNEQKKTGLQFFLVIFLIIMGMASLIASNIFFDQRMQRDTLELTQQLAGSGMDARQIDAVRVMMQSTSRNVSSYVWTAVFSILVVLTNIVIIIVGIFFSRKQPNS